MALERNYPQNITPGGTNIEQGFKNDDNEIKRILGLLDSTGSVSLAGTKRQCVLYGSVDSSGNPNFLSTSGLNVSIDGSAKPIILSFANGFSSTQGTIDILDAITGAVSNAWTIPASGTYYLYIDKDINTGLLSYGYTDKPDTYLKAEPSSPVLDQHYFDINETKMYRYNGSNWEQKLRIFVGDAITGSSTMTLTIYDMATKTIYLPTLNGKKISELSPNILQRSRKYNIGDIQYSTSLPSWARAECVIDGTSSANEIDLSTISQAGQYITDGTVKWIIDDIRDGNMVGDTVGKTYIPDGYIKANGATVNRDDYPRLINLATKYNLFYDADTTYTFTGNTALNNTTISAISTEDIAKLYIGMTITGPGIADNTTITAISTASITISVKATAAGTAISISYGNINNFPAFFGVGDGSATFVVPDWRGIATRYLDDSKGYDDNRLLGSYQEDMIKSHNHTLRCYGEYNGGAGGGGRTTYCGTATTSSTGGVETRMKNIAIYPLIKY